MKWPAEKSAGLFWGKMEGGLQLRRQKYQKNLVDNRRKNYELQSI